jgi:hypothetical protein
MKNIASLFIIYAKYNFVYKLGLFQKFFLDSFFFRIVKILVLRYKKCMSFHWFTDLPWCYKIDFINKSYLPMEIYLIARSLAGFITPKIKLFK